MSVYYDKRSHNWCMDIRFGNERLQIHSPEQQLLVRMQSIIKTNRPIGIPGTKLLIIIAIPLTPPAAILLGWKKYTTDIATRNTPKVINIKSLKLPLFIIYSYYLNYYNYVSSFTSFYAIYIEYYSNSKLYHKHL